MLTLTRSSDLHAKTLDAEPALTLSGVENYRFRVRRCVPPSCQDSLDAAKRRPALRLSRAENYREVCRVQIYSC